METKALQVQIKNESEGVVRARFATLGVKDKDGDVIERGAFGKQKVKVSAYGHTSWAGALPVGVGEIHEDGDEAIADLRFFMDTTHGRDHFETVKGLGDLGEWSFGFDIMEEARPDDDQAEKGVFRVLKKLAVHEVSPVLRGAGQNTATLAVKCDACAAKAAEEEEHEDKTLTSARTPTFKGTEDSDWSKPTLEDYQAGLDLGDAMWADLSAADRGRIVAHTLIGEAGAETFDEANAFPVVNPRTGRLNGNAVRNAAARASQAGLSSATVDSIRSKCSALLDEHFGSGDGKDDLSVEVERELARFALTEAKMLAQ